MLCFMYAKVMCDTVAELDCLILVCVLRILFVKCRSKQESPPTFILSNQEKEKRIEKTFFRDILSTGVDYRKGRC